MNSAKVVSIALISILIAVFPSRASGQDEARALLDKVTERYGSLKQYHFEGTTTVTMMAKGTATEIEMQTVMISDGPTRNRMEMTSPVFGMVRVTNGETTWVYLPALNQYIEKPTAEIEKNAGGEIDGSSFGMGGFDKLLKSQVSALQDLNKRVKKARILREETIYPQGAAIDCVVIEVEQAMADGSPISMVRTLWMEKARLLIVRQQILIKMKGPGESGDMEIKTVSLLHTARINEPIPDSSFTFAPPSGAKLVDDFAAPRAAGRGAADTETGEPASPFVGKEAGDFTLKDPDGKKVELKSLRGKVVVLDFWATWCLPCREEMPHLEKLHRELKDKGLVIIGINTEDAKAARSFMKKYDYTFMTLIDDGKASATYGIDAIPTVFVIDKAGKVTSHYVGAQSEETLRRAIKKAGVE